MILFSIENDSRGIKGGNSRGIDFQKSLKIRDGLNEKGNVLDATGGARNGKQQRIQFS